MSTTTGRSTFDPQSIPARRRYLRRITKLVHNILKWQRYTKERDGLGLTITGLVGDVLFPLARGGWEAGGEEAIREVCTTSCTLVVTLALWLTISQVVRVLSTELVPVNVKAALQ
jgi:GC-rich sequence DNA-binding factor